MTQAKVSEALVTDTDADEADDDKRQTQWRRVSVFPLTPQWAVALSVCCILLADPWQDPHCCRSRIP